MFKKGFEILSAVVVAMITISSATAFAEDVQSDAKQDEKQSVLKFTYGIGGWLYGTKIQSTTKDENGNWIDFRIRPEFTLANGETSFKMRLEIDGLYGAYANSSTTNAMPVNADTRNVEVAYAYFQSKIKAVSGLTFVGGIAPDVVRVPFIFSDNAPLVAVQEEIGPAKINLAYVKIAEGDLMLGNDDSQMGWINADLKITVAKITPFFAYLKSGKTAALNTANLYGTSASGFYKAMGNESNAYLGGILVSADIGSIGIDATFEYGKGKNKSTDVKYSGYAADLGVSLALDPFKITLFGTNVSGDSGSNSTKSNAFTNFYLDNNHASSMGRRMFLLERAYTSQLSGSVAGKCGTDQGVASKKNGYLLGGLQAEMRFHDFRFKAQTAYAQLDKVASGADKDLGFEFDFGVYYNAAAGTTLYVELASLLAGKAFDTTTTTTTSTSTTTTTVKAADPYAIIVGSTFKM
jgi:hypothetical protein